MFALPQHKAHEKDKASNYILQKTFIDFHKRQIKTNQTKNSKNNNVKFCTILRSKTPKSELLTLNLGLLSSTLST